jgi:hypothetical protein
MQHATMQLSTLMNRVMETAAGAADQAEPTAAHAHLQTMNQKKVKRTAHYN